MPASALLWVACAYSLTKLELKHHHRPGDAEVMDGL